MPVEWYEAPDKVIEMAQELIDAYHPGLEEARIGFIMRSEAPVANGGATYGQARVVSARDQVHMPFDFIIWLAADTWADLTPAQQRALVDHELMHCKWDAAHEKATIRLHDIEEFAAIIQRHGYWSPAYGSIAPTLQQGVLLPEARMGGVSAIPVTNRAGAQETVVTIDGRTAVKASAVIDRLMETWEDGEKDKPEWAGVELSVQRAHR